MPNGHRITGEGGWEAISYFRQKPGHPTLTERNSVFKKKNKSCGVVVNLNIII